VLDSPALSPGAVAGALLVAGAEASSFCLGGRPRRLRLAGGSSVSASSGFFSCNGMRMGGVRGAENGADERVYLAWSAALLLDGRV